MSFVQVDCSVYVQQYFHFVNIVLVFNRLTMHSSFTVFLVDYRANLNRFIITLFLEDLMSIAGLGNPRQGALTFYLAFFSLKTA